MKRDGCNAVVLYSIWRPSTTEVDPVAAVSGFYIEKAMEFEAQFEFIRAR